MHIYVYSISLGSVRPCLLCFHLSTGGGVAAFFSMMGLFGGETVKNPETLRSCYKGVT